MSTKIFQPIQDTAASFLAHLHVISEEQRVWNEELEISHEQLITYGKQLSHHITKCISFHLFIVNEVTLTFLDGPDEQSMHVITEECLRDLTALKFCLNGLYKRAGPTMKKQVLFSFSK